MALSLDREEYEAAVDSIGYDPLRDDCFEDNMLALYEQSMTAAQNVEYMASLRKWEAQADDPNYSADISTRLVLAQRATDKRLPTLAEMFERLTGGGFMDEVDLYALIWND